MVSKLGLVLLLLIALALLIVIGTIPLGEPVRSLVLAVLLIPVGALGLLRTQEVISPWFARSRFNLWILRGLGSVWLLLGVAGFVGALGKMVGAK